MSIIARRHYFVIGSFIHSFCQCRTSKKCVAGSLFIGSFIGLLMDCDTVS